MIHVLHVLPDLGRGGAERVTASLIAATDKSRFRHSVCYLRGRDDLAAEIRATGCEVICLNARGRLPWLTGASPLRRELSRLKPDVIHSAIFEANIAARIARVGLGIPHLNWLVAWTTIQRLFGPRAGPSAAIDFGDWLTQSHRTSADRSSSRARTLWHALLSPDWKFRLPECRSSTIRLP